MDEYENFFDVLLKIAGGMVVLWGAYTVVDNCAKARRILKERVKCLEEDNKAIKSTLNEVTETNKKLCTGVFAILDHIATGNNIVQIKSARDDLKKHLIDSL